MSKLEELAKSEFKWLAKRSLGMDAIRDLILHSDADDEVKFYAIALYDKALFWILAAACVFFLLGFIFGSVIAGGS
jgi:hypothetical protein